jgi:predicted RNA methylase
MHNFYPTPSHIVTSIIKKHIPRKARSFLDPSIGNGALIQGMKFNEKHLTCVDIDKTRLEFVEHLLGEGNYQFIHEDFLERDFGFAKFDCVICNPPFDGRKQYIDSSKKIPIEAAFLRKALSLISDKGRLIFILPSSVSKGSRLKWFRETILKEFHLSYSYKLPKFTFQDIEGEFSVVILDKRTGSGASHLRGSDNSRITLKSNDITKVNSFDSDEIIAFERYSSMISLIPFESVPFLDLFSLTRGPIASNYKKNNVLHTTNYFNFIDENKVDVKDNSNHKMDFGDWMIKRVARNLLESVTEYKGSSSEYTDCILRLRAINRKFEIESFFAFHILTQLYATKNLLVKGSGASYLDVTALKNLKVPYGIHEYFVSDFEKYVNASHKSRLLTAKKCAFILENKTLDVVSSNKYGSYPIRAIG